MSEENHLTSDVPTGDTSGVDADALLSQIEAGGEVGDPGEATRQAPTEGIAPKPQEETPQTYKINVGGKEVEATQDQLIQWAQQGRDYAQKMAEFKAQQEEWGTTKQDLEQKVNQYQEIDGFIKENPEWWQNVLQSYEQAKTGQSSTQFDQATLEENPALAAVVNELEQIKNQNKELTQFKDEILAQREAFNRQKEDEQLDQEISSLREQYSKFDWDTPDQNGNSLEKQVLLYAQENGIPKFTAAFKDYFHDQIVKAEIEQALLKKQEDTRATTKMGLLGKSPAPTKGINSAENVKNKSYEDLLNEAFQEAGLA